MNRILKKEKPKMEELNYSKIIKEICNFLRREFNERKKSCAVLGISGGVDSAVTAFLCKKAGLDLYLVFMPYGNLSGRENVKKLIQALNHPKDRFFEIDITKMVDSQVREIKKRISVDKTDKGNMMARTRMIIQYSLARKLNGLVVGTENASEYWLGYFTLHGDQACDINPLRTLWKTQVLRLARHLGVPSEILRQKPSAGLYHGQTDEGELGFSYKEADPILYLFCIKNYSKEKIVKDYKFSPDLVEKVLERVKRTQFKREKTPSFDIEEKILYNKKFFEPLKYKKVV